MSSEADVQEIPDIIVDKTTRTTYTKGRFFGKGGFAKCYELTDQHSNKVYAGKIVSKVLMRKDNQREKISQEISIHQSLKHKHVVGFNGFFEDSHNVYIILELCRKRSMMELHKRRKTLTEPETRYYMRQIIDGVNYLHNHRIIHRDLKLGNLFLNDDLEVKIGDFGLAAKIEHDGERKKTLCGTPNYIAPEILTKKGHSFEVDIWSIGCIMYTLLMGRPPFETNSLKETYARIKKCDYRQPKGVSQSAVNMIVRALQPEPKRRPTVAQLIQDDFFINGLLPAMLPTSSLTMPPRMDQLEKVAIRHPLNQLQPSAGGVQPMELGSPVSQKLAMKASRQSIAARGVEIAIRGGHNDFNNVENLKEIRDMLKMALDSKPGKENYVYREEMSDPAAQPLVWVARWVDYSDKYGFGYQLSDESFGVMFNDSTKLIILSNGKNIHYIDRRGDESYMTINDYPKALEKKMKLLSYFQRYMNEHLVKAGAAESKELDCMSRIPNLYQWIRSTSSVLMQLTNGTVQFNFMDHTKVILCPLMGAITYIDEEKNFRTFRVQSIIENGCSLTLEKNLLYASNKIKAIIDPVIHIGSNV